MRQLTGQCRFPFLCIRPALELITPPSPLTALIFITKTSWSPRQLLIRGKFKFVCHVFFVKEDLFYLVNKFQVGATLQTAVHKLRRTNNPLKRTRDQEYCYKSCKYYIPVFSPFRVVVRGEGGCSIPHGRVRKHDRG